MRVKELLNDGKALLGDRENSSLDAELVLANVLGVSREYLFSHDDEEIETELIDLFSNYIKRIKEGEPVAYILKEKEFYGFNFFVDNRVLVPRPETEQIVERVFEFIDKNDDDEKLFRVLDVGTGSGNIAVALAKHERISEVLALDVDRNALEVAEINVEQFSLEREVQLVESDLLDAVEEGEEFDIIVSNLPYIGTVKNNYVSSSSEKYEPHVALFGGEDGLELYKKMFQQVVEKRVSFDLLIGEFGFAQENIMSELLDTNFAHKWVVEKDLAGIERVFMVSK